MGIRTADRSEISLRAGRQNLKSAEVLRYRGGPFAGTSGTQLFVAGPAYRTNSDRDSQSLAGERMIDIHHHPAVVCVDHAQGDALAIGLLPRKDCAFLERFVNREQ